MLCVDMVAMTYIFSPASSALTSRAAAECIRDETCTTCSAVGAQEADSMNVVNRKRRYLRCSSRYGLVLHQIELGRPK